MRKYQLLHFIVACAVGASDDIDSSTDETAVLLARAHHKGMRAELWEGERLVAAFEFQGRLVACTEGTPFPSLHRSLSQQQSATALH